MGHKRKKIDEYPDEWDVVEATQNPDDIPPPFETVAETPESEIDSGTDALSQLAPKDPYRLKQTTTNTHSSVICKLTCICRVPELIEEIKRICVVMKQVQLEGWHLANLHVLRCLKEDKDLPELGQMFFYRCCTASLENVETRDRCTSQPKHPSLHRTCLGYWSGRERVVSYAAESLVNGDGMINEMAKLMKINAGNMIALHFRRRLHQYIRFRYAPKGKIELKYKDTKRLVDSCYRVKLVPELDEDESPTGKMVKSWTKWDETADPVEKALREWLEIVPWQW
ncbi:hypothetical protein V7S43_004754 [Phytophthora oleae]|uniref:Uncharacterized protein n=1 Tax=Phytophthora oleae TaxID=2107226 RepID=A0ABD3FXG1_9STRA